MTPSATPLESIARLPAPSDNAAVALTDIPAGTRIECGGRLITISSHVLEGHRFAVEPIEPGQAVTSWGIPFGRATRLIAPGDYLANQMMLDALEVRNVPFELPSETNFEDFIPEVDQHAPGVASEQVSNQEQLHFHGFRRDDGRGTGTRNYVVVLATSALANAAARRLVTEFNLSQKIPPSVDGVVAVTHTEGGSRDRPNNHDLVLRSLVGFIEHPNVGGVLAVDSKDSFINNQLLRERLEFGREHGHAQHLDFESSPESDADVAAAHDKLKKLVEIASQTQRTEAPISELKIALQCGGSDAFSGISGNPLAGELAKRVVAGGGSANLAETSELIGAESYILSKVPDAHTADKFLGAIARFQEWAGWHGHSAAGNPSGGNLYRGLYNITIKSIGAGMKNHPDVRLDEVIEYGERMRTPGFHFMDSAGNDLESIAGQVASGCNIILFITGNGSITNFPFVPTIKIVTTTRRYELLKHEMDVNAGRYLDGTPMDQLAGESFEQLLRVASGEQSAGERAGHSQVQLWRDWQQTDATRLESIVSAAPPSGLPIKIGPPASNHRVRDVERPKINLIAPTSLCSGQIALMIAEKLNRRGDAKCLRYVALAHTEGCGVSRGPSEELFVRTLVNHARHPMISHCLFLEHGCEKTHNDEFRKHLRSLGLNPSDFGWASIQSAGGIEAVTRNVVAWFEAHSTDNAQITDRTIAILSTGEANKEIQEKFAARCRSWVGGGRSVVVNANAGLLRSTDFAELLGCNFEDLQRPTLAHGERPGAPGFHVMETPTDIAAEIMTGLAASGARAILTIGNGPFPQHPFVPVHDWHPDVDFTNLASQQAEGSVNRFDVEFQITRGELGVSL